MKYNRNDDDSCPNCGKPFKRKGFENICDSCKADQEVIKCSKKSLEERIADLERQVYFLSKELKKLGGTNCEY